MRIYFSAAVSLSSYYGENYKKIVDVLEKLGHQVVHEHITLNSLDKIFSKSRHDNIEFYKKIVKEINKKKCRDTAAELDQHGAQCAEHFE